MISKFLSGFVLFCIPCMIIGASLSDQSSSDSNLPSIRLDQLISPQLQKHPGLSGAFVLEKGEQALFARAWLTAQATQSIDVQYFIWSTDNVGILAAEALLQAAERGVKVRVIVDDFLIDAEHQNLLALAAHPNVHIRIYNPKHSVGVSALKRAFNVLTSFRQSNQRMHDKVFIVDRVVAITGGRNMADEYFDYDHSYNFRDRDVLLAGPVVAQMNHSFDTFWQDELSVPAENLLRDEIEHISAAQIKLMHKELHQYAQNPQNFAPTVRSALANMGDEIEYVIQHLKWSQNLFISDSPGKNPNRFDMGGGGRSTSALVELLSQAKQSVTIQSPYLVMPEGGYAVFGSIIKNGVKVRVSTNSLASTDNLYAFSGYRVQRPKLLKLGMEIYEYKPYPQVLQTLLREQQQQDPPIFALHAKTMVIDSEILYIGTFNFDPRSANLNTEVGVIIHNAELAQRVEQAMETDMQPENSWNASTDDPDSYSSWWKRTQAFLFGLLPLDPVL